MSELSTAVCSITATQRRRFFWAAWWTGAPSVAPFRKPDAANGGARSEEEALAEASRVAGRHLLVIDPYWARAFTRVLRGEAPPSRPEPNARASTAPRSESPTGAPSAWALLGVASGASLVEVRRAFRKRALESHPDRGGNADDFRAAQRAYERLSKKIAGRPTPGKRR